MHDDKLKVKAIVGSAFVYILFVGSYWFFASYKPKALSEVREVRGYKVQQETDVFDLPYPRYAIGLAADQTLNTKKFTFQTDRQFLYHRVQKRQSFSYSMVLL